MPIFFWSLFVQTLRFLTVLTFLFACGKTDEISDACITSCPPSVPGKINIAIEDHTSFDIKNLTLEINGETVPFALFSKSLQGSYSCWKSYTKIESISFIEFNIGENAVHQETVNYEDLPNEKEFTIDISSVSSGIRVQLVEAPCCISDAR